MKKFFEKIILFLAIILLCSCSKWLDVQPQDKFTEDQVFSSRQNVYNAFNAIYLNMSKNSLYGRNLTMLVPDILAQLYNIGSQHTYYAYASYNYTSSNTMATFDDIWTEEYVTITTINAFLNNLDKSTSVLTSKEDSIIRGEAYGIRAFVHFDLLRLFGPIYNSSDSTLSSIPYYITTSTNYNAYLPANEVMDSIYNDISKAERYLIADPILINGVAGDNSVNADGFFQNRNYRMNYWSLQALKARVALYRNDKVLAYNTSTEVINKAQSLFPWITTAKIISEKSNPDRIFSTEVLFGLQHTGLYTVYQNYFDPNLTDGNILAPLDARLKTSFEDPTPGINDFRYYPSWIIPTVGNKTYRTFYKYADVINAATTFRYTIPLIRISEMYYIAAETATDINTSIGYLNTVRYNRGITNLTSSANLATEIRKEYIKEFYGEGQLFYYYKRINATTIPNGAATSGNITMNKAKYVIPIPQSETTYH